MRGFRELAPPVPFAALYGSRAFLSPERTAALSPSRPSEVYILVHPSDFLFPQMTPIV